MIANGVVIAMKKDIIRITFVKIFILIAGALSASAASLVFSDDREIKEENADINDGPFLSAITGIDINGGISAGYFYSSNPGEDTSDDAFLLSNLLVELSSSDDTLPVGFVGAFGETSTPSVLSTPENNTDFQVEYASLTLKPVPVMSLELGLLQPNCGYENTYTFDNENIILGAIASQQPYNSYGARITYDMKNFSLWGGYFKDRLNDEEYNSSDNAWEIGLNGTIFENAVSVFHFSIKDQRSLTGAIIERTINNIDFAFIIDYWRWDSSMKNLYGSSWSIGVAIYISPDFGRFSFPMRFEYIDLKNSEIYIENPDTKNIYTATVSPTWHYTENTYIRAEAAYVKAGGAFADENGNIRDNRINLAIELGFIF